MGPSHAPRLRIWKLRFEALLVTPKVILIQPDQRMAHVQDDCVMLLGNRPSRMDSMTPYDNHKFHTWIARRFLWPKNQEQPERYLQTRNSRPRVVSDELAEWLGLLHSIHVASRATLCGSALAVGVSPPTPRVEMEEERIPAVRLHLRSWEFQPPEIIWHLAKTTLSTIDILARRMAMRWIDFRPGDGVLRAESNHHTITSTVVRGLGIVLQHTNTDSNNALHS